MELPQLFRLLSWLSPSFPVGSYTYSHGLEFAVETGLVHDRGTLEEWVEGTLRFGTGRMDAVIFVSAYRATPGDLADLGELATALKGTREFSQESLRQGRAFVSALEASRPAAAGKGPDPVPIPKASSWPYPLVVALACRQHDIPLTCALAAYLHSFGANLVSAGIRLVPLGHTDGQIVLARLETPVGEVVAEALQAREEDWGTATPMLDWVSMRHESQRTRLFRS